MVTVPEPTPPDLERLEWIRLSQYALAQAYGDSEPEYSIADLLPS